MSKRGTMFFLLILALAIMTVQPVFADSPGNSDWPMGGYDLANHRYNPNEHILTPDTVGMLKPRWTFAFPGTEIASVPPTVIGDTVYIGSWNGSVYAIDAATGKQRWNFATALTGRKGSVRVAIAVSGDLVLFGDQLGRFFALHKDTGQLAWVQEHEPSTDPDQRFANCLRRPYLCPDVFSRGGGWH